MSESYSVTSEHFACAGMDPAQLEIDSLIANSTLDITAEIPEEVPILKQADINVLTLGDFSCISGRAKSRKTFLISAMVGAFLSEEEYLGFEGTNNTGSVLYIDTEQAIGDVMRVAKRIYRIAGWKYENNDKIRFLHLREYTPEQRKAITKRAIDKYKPTFCVIDGIADLMSNGVNDITESVEIATMLLNLSEVYNCHIMTAIHTNPDGGKMRGHAGSEIARKAELVLQVSKDGESSLVEPVFSRRKEPEKFAFFIGSDGLPIRTDIQNKKPSRVKLESGFAQILPPPITLNYTDLTQKVIDAFGVKVDMAKKKITQATKEGIIQQNTAGYYHLPAKSISDETLPF